MNSGFYALMIAAAALWGGREALAVNPGEVSQSAEAVCVFRAIAAQHLADGKPGARMFNWTRLIEVKVP